MPKVGTAPCCARRIEAKWGVCPIATPVIPTKWGLLPKQMYRNGGYTMFRPRILYWVMGTIAAINRWTHPGVDEWDNVHCGGVHNWAEGQYFRIWAELGHPNLQGKFSR